MIKFEKKKDIIYAKKYANFHTNCFKNQKHSKCLNFYVHIDIQLTNLK